MLTNDAVRAELERIDNSEQTLIWLFEGSQLRISGVDLAIFKALRLLAESQQALGKMNKKVCKAIDYLMKDSPRHPDGRSKEMSYFQNGMDRLMDAKKIARNAVKGGK